MKKRPVAETLERAARRRDPPGCVCGHSYEQHLTHSQGKGLNLDQDPGPLLCHCVLSSCPCLKYTTEAAHA